MAWLVRGEEVLAATEERWWRRGPRGGVLVLRPPLLFGLRLGPPSGLGLLARLDVAWCKSDAAADSSGWRVRRVARDRWLRPSCLWGAGVLVARAGSFERWHLQVGDMVEVTGQ